MFIYRRPLSALLAAFITVFILLSIDALAMAPAANPSAGASCPRESCTAAQSRCAGDGQSVTSLRDPG